MYKMGLLTAAGPNPPTLSGQTMRLNPTATRQFMRRWCAWRAATRRCCIRLSTRKGNFGKVYSRDMAYAAASRYTEAKLDAICQELFRDIDADTVDFVDNYDGTMKEPTLLPTTFPNVLVSANMGIAVGMASNICSFNLSEVCKTAVALIKNPEADLLTRCPHLISRPAARFSTTRRRCCKFTTPAGEPSASEPDGAISKKGT